MANTLRVLLIDADPQESERISSLLSCANHSVVAASDLEEASEVLEIQRFDAVLLGAPTESDAAATLAARLRELDKRQHGPARTPILSMSESEEDSGSFQPDGYLPPGFDPAALADTVANLARALSTSARQASPGAGAPVFDAAKLTEQAGGDRELVLEIIGLFLSDCDGQLAQMRNALQDADYDRLSYVAHTIKGSLGTLGAALCWSRAQELELAAKRRNGQLCAELLPLLEDGLATLLPDLRHLCSQSGNL